MPGNASVEDLKYLGVTYKPKRQWRVPRSIIEGILRVESNSYLTSDDEVVWVNRSRGAHGERGPTQLRRIALVDIARPNDYYRIEHEMEVAIDATETYLLKLYRQLGSWNKAIAAYNTGASRWNTEAGSIYRKRVWNR